MVTGNAAGISAIAKLRNFVDAVFPTLKGTLVYELFKVLVVTILSSRITPQHSVRFLCSLREGDLCFLVSRGQTLFRTRNRVLPRETTSRAAGPKITLRFPHLYC